MTTDNQIAEDLFALARMEEEEIDVSDIPETQYFRPSYRRRFDFLERKTHDVRAIANWFISKARAAKISPTKTWSNKMAYFAYEMAIVEKNVVITPARVEAWNYGPVFREIFFKFERVDAGGLLRKFSLEGRTMIDAIEPFDEDVVQVLEKTWERFARLSGTRLSHLTHESGAAWDTVWNLGGSENPGMVIDPATILSAAHKNNDRRYRN